MDEQSRPVEPQDGQGTEDTGTDAPEERGTGVPAAETTGKLRAAYLDPRGSESTRELRDTARRRRDAEEKLQQHLMEAKHHVPNEFHEHHGHEHSGAAGQGTAAQGSGHAEPAGAQEDGTAGQDPSGDES